MSERVIKTEAELFKALVAVMRRNGETREYPKAVVQMSEFILKRVDAHGSVSNVDIIEAFGTLEGACPGCGAGQQSALGTLFHRMADHAGSRMCNAILVELTARQIQFMEPGYEVSCLQMILDAIELLPDGGDWFAGEQHGRTSRSQARRAIRTDLWDEETAPAP